ncbi:MAG: GtrA family protein [Planctomycetaceae bacterium]
MAGFFALHRDTFQAAQQLDPIGYKIGLELMVKCGCRRVLEIPIHFQDRLYGESKLSLKEQLNYLRHLGRLYQFRLGRWAQPLMFSLVGASGMVVDLAAFSVLLTVLGFGAARAIAIVIAMTWNFVLNRRFTFAHARQRNLAQQYLLFCLSCSLGAAVNWGVSNFLWQHWAGVVRDPRFAALAGVAAGVVLNYLLSAKFVFQGQRRSSDTSSERDACRGGILVASPPPAEDTPDAKMPRRRPNGNLRLQYLRQRSLRRPHHGGTGWGYWLLSCWG